MYKKIPKSPKPTTTNNDKVRNLSANKNESNASQIAMLDIERVDHLKLAIHGGNYTINPLRVAEKFIQFENQLSV